MALISVSSHSHATAVISDGELLVGGAIDTGTGQHGALNAYVLDADADSYSGATQTTTYSYDVRNKLSAVAVNGITQASYTYDDDGDRVSETVNGGTTLYLNDKVNPTGYDQPLVEKDAATGQMTLAYDLGDRVLGQAEPGGQFSYLVVDGHGSTRMLSSTGLPAATFNYDAFGDPLNFNPGTAGTAFLFGGDAQYDAPSGLYIHGNGIRDRMGFFFIERDTYQGNTQDPLSLHKYLYVDANPVMGRDPSGYLLEEELFGAAEGASLDASSAGAANGVEGVAEEVFDEVESQQLMDMAYEDEELGIGPYDSDYDPGQLVWDHNPARSIADFLGMDSEETQLLERLMNSVKGGREGQILEEITGWKDAGWEISKIKEAILPELLSTEASGFEISVNPFLLDLLPG